MTLNINLHTKIFATFLTLCFLTFFTQTSFAQMSIPKVIPKGVDVSNFDMKNPKAALTNILTGGQPSENDLNKLKEQGYSHVINLRGLDEKAGFDEQALVDQLGMNYTSIPINGAGDLTLENAKKLADALKGMDGKTLIHCASGNRAGAMLALKAFYVDKKSAGEALLIGKSSGMTSLESAVVSQIMPK